MKHSPPKRGLYGAHRALIAGWDYLPTTVPRNARQFYSVMI
ncbi:hypothetical protein [Escherichia coli]|nr:hypothetical protein [Escherichia coli]